MEIVEKDEKSRSRSVSMSEDLWDLVGQRCSDLKEDRSGYVRGLVLADLQSAGLLPEESGYAELHDACIEAANRHGKSAVMEVLARMIESEGTNG